MSVNTGKFHDTIGHLHLKTCKLLPTNVKKKKKKKCISLYSDTQLVLNWSSVHVISRLNIEGDVPDAYFYISQSVGFFFCLQDGA